MKAFSLPVLLLLFLISCSSPKPGTNVYKLDIKSWPNQTIVLDKVIKEIRIIPLETKPECLISYISDMQFTPDMIVTLDGETLQMNCFGLDGKFLRKFGTRGKGPGEYATAAGMLVNQERSEVLLNRSPTRRVNFYNLSGQFLRTIDQEFSGYRMKLIDKDLVAVHAGKFGFNMIHCELAVLDHNGKIRKTWFRFKDPVPGDLCFGFAAGTKPGSVLYHKRFDYHVYEIFSDRIETLLTVDFGSAAIDTGAFLNTEKIDQLMGEEGKIFGFASLTNTPDHLIANIYHNRGFRGVWILDHRSKNQQYLAVDTLFSLGNYKGIPVHYPRYTDASWFIWDSDGVDWYEAISKLSESQKVILRKEVPGFLAAEKVTRDGNPVLVMYKFKEFR